MTEPTHPTEFGVSDSDRKNLAQRDQSVLRERSAGRTYQEIADRHGVSRERVRQIIKKHGGPTVPEVKAARAIRESERLERVTQAIRTWLETNGPGTIEDVAEAISIPEDVVVTCWPKDLTNLRIRPAFGKEVWSDAQIRAALTTANTFEHPLTGKGYEELRRVGEVVGPSRPLLTRRFGSWSAACVFAGVESAEAIRDNYESNWTDSDILGFVREYLDDPGFSGAYHRYDAWRKEKAPDAPSAPTIRIRFGPWSRVKQLAFRHGEGRSGQT